MNDKTKGDPHNNYKKELIQDPGYLAYIGSGSSAGVFIVRYKAEKIKTANKWIDILDIDADEVSYTYTRKRQDRYEPDKYRYVELEGRVWDVRYLRAEIFPRKIQPYYPRKAVWQSKEDYQAQVDYICWQTATEDIARQREEGIRGPVWELEVALYDKNQGKKPSGRKPVWDYRIISATKL